jgi:predicted nucleic acid-binding protein
VIAYIDTSVLLRVLLQQPGILKEWDQLEIGLASVLLRVEALRGLDFLWHRRELDAAELFDKRQRLAEFWERLDLKEITPPILDIAAQPFPTPIRTLDAIHLATAIVSRRRAERPLVFATHDTQLARAARAMHFDVIGSPE